MTAFEARIIRTDGPVEELPSVRLVLVPANAPEQAIAAIQERYPDWTVELMDRPASEREAEGLKPGEPT